MHFGVGSSGFKVDLDVVFANEMRHIGWVFSASVDRGVDEDLDVVGDSLIHHSFPLLGLAFLCSPILNSLQDAENAPDGLTIRNLESGFEDVGSIVEVALDQFYDGGFGREGFSGGRVRIPGESEDGKVGFGVGG